MQISLPTPGETVSGIPGWFGEFFGQLPEAAIALWEFGDPSNLGRGWWGIVIVLIWGVLLIGGPLVVAKRTYGTHEWISATMGTVAFVSAGWWVFGILPSAWIYYLDANKEVLENVIIPASVGINFASGYRLDIASNFYEVVRDSVVMIQLGVGLVLAAWGALKVQERFPRGLVEGEEKPEAGGYR